MDKNILSILEDDKELLDKLFKRLDKKLKSADLSQVNSLKDELKNIEKSIDKMKQDANDLKSEENINKWKDIISKIKSKIKEYDKKIDKIKNSKQSSSQIPVDEHLNPDAKADLNKLNAQPVINRGDAILDADDNAIDNMAKIVNNDVDQMKNVNVELNAQQEKLENVDSDLKEMDYSLKRAGKQITNMFKLYAKDKCILGLIIIIVIIIVVIIIVSICGGDNEKNFNVPHDIFGTNNNNTSSKVSNNMKNINNISLRGNDSGNNTIISPGDYDLLFSEIKQTSDNIKNLES